MTRHPSSHPRAAAALLLFAAAGLLLVAPARCARAECSPTHTAEADNAYNAVLDLIAAGNWSAAIPSLESALKICPDHQHSLEALAKAYRGAGRLEESRSTYEKLIQVRGSAAEAALYADYGVTLAQLKDYPAARVQFGKAYALSPQDCGVIMNLALMHGAVQDFRRAVEMYEKALEVCGAEQNDKIYPRLSDAAKKAADKETKIGNTAEADIFRRKYQQYAVQSGGAQGADVVAKLMAEKRWDEAIDALQKILADDPDRKSARYNLARCLDAKGSHSQAAAEFERYLQLDPDNEKAAAFLIITLAESGRCAEALSHAQQAVARFTPKGLQAMGGIYYGFGKALECGSDYASAREKFRLSASSGDLNYSQSGMLKHRW